MNFGSSTTDYRSVCFPPWVQSLSKGSSLSRVHGSMDPMVSVVRSTLDGFSTNEKYMRFGFIHSRSSNRFLQCRNFCRGWQLSCSVKWRSTTGKSSWCVSRDSRFILKGKNQTFVVVIVNMMLIFSNSEITHDQWHDSWNVCNRVN